MPEGRPREHQHTVHRVYHRADGDATLTESVIGALAEVEGVDPLELSAPLHDSIDPDALNQIFAPRYDGTPRMGGTIEFANSGHRVVVTSDGEITVHANDA